MNDTTDINNWLPLLRTLFQGKIEGEVITIPAGDFDYLLETKKNILIINDEDNGQSADQNVRLKMPVGHFCFLKFNRIGDTYVHGADAPFYGFIKKGDTIDIGEFDYHTIFRSENWMIVFREEKHYHILARASGGPENGREIG